MQITTTNKVNLFDFLSSRKRGHYTCQVEYTSVHSWGYYLLNGTMAATLASSWQRDVNKYLINVILVKYLKPAYLKLVDSKLQCRKKSPNVSFYFCILNILPSLLEQQNIVAEKCRHLIMMYVFSPDFQSCIEKAVKI